MGILSEREIRRLIQTNMKPYERLIEEGKTVRITDRESFKIVRKVGGRKVAEHYLGEMDPILRDIVSKVRKNSITTEADVKEYLKGCRVQAFVKVAGKNRKKKYKFPIDPEMVKADENVTQPEFLDKIYKNYYRFGVDAVDYYNMDSNVRSALEDATAIDLPEFGNYDPQNVEFVLSFIDAQKMTAADKDLERAESQARREGESQEDFEERTGRKFTTVTRGEKESAADFERRTGISAVKQNIKQGASKSVELKPKPYLVQRQELKEKSKTDPEVKKIIEEIEGFEERYKLEPLGYEIIYFDKNRKPEIEINPPVPKPKEKPKGTVLTLRDFKIEVDGEGGKKKVSIPEAEVGMADMFAEVYAGNLLLKIDGKGADTTRVKNQIRVLHQLLKDLKDLEGFDPTKFELKGDVYTKDTYDAVKAYQKAIKKQAAYANMTVDGKVGRQTIGSLDNKLKGKLIPITGKEFSFSAEDAKNIGLPEITSEHKPKLYQKESDYEYLSGPHKDDEKLYLAQVVFKYLKGANAPIGEYQITGEGKRVDVNEITKGAVGSVEYLGEDEISPKITSGLQKIIFTPGDVDYFTAEERRTMFILTTVARGEEKGIPPNFIFRVNFIPAQDQPEK